MKQKILQLEQLGVGRVVRNAIQGRLHTIGEPLIADEKIPGFF
jgi:hypothetical protein